MEPINNVTLQSANFAASPATKTSTTERIKEKWNNLEDTQKAGVIVGAGLTAVGTIMLAIHLIKKGKAPKLSTPETPKTVAPAPKNYNQVTVQHTPKQEQIQQATELGQKRANEAVSQYLEGGNYGKIKKEATRNLPRKAKDIAKEALGEEHSKKVAQDIKKQHQAADTALKSASLRDKSKNTRQGAQNAKTEKKLNKIADASIDAAQEAQEAAKKAQKYAKETGTDKAKKLERIAEHNAQRAEVEAQKTIERCDELNQKIAQQQKQKAANIQAQKESPNYEDGLIKQMLNQDKTQANAIKRQAQKEEKAIQEATENFTRRRLGEKGLKNIINSPKSKPAQIEAAKRMLAQLAK